MQEFIKSLDAEYNLDSYKIKDHVVVMRISSTKKLLNCPYCGMYSGKVHSTYEREIQDLPMQDRKVVLLVRTRKMFCNNDKCNRRTFSERHGFVSEKGKKTYRLEEDIVLKSTQLSSISASRILKAEHVDVCKSSICVLLKKNAGNCG